MLKLLARIYDIEGRDAVHSVLIQSHGTVIFWQGSYYAVSVAAAIAHAQCDFLQIQAPTGAHRLGHHDPIAVKDNVMPYIDAAEEVIKAFITLHSSSSEATATASASANETQRRGRRARARTTTKSTRLIARSDAGGGVW